MVRVTASVWVRTFEVIVKCRCVANVINTPTASTTEYFTAQQFSQVFKNKVDKIRSATAKFLVKYVRPMTPIEPQFSFASVMGLGYGMV